MPSSKLRFYSSLQEIDSATGSTSKSGSDGSNPNSNPPSPGPGLMSELKTSEIPVNAK